MFWTGLGFFRKKPVSSGTLEEIWKKPISSGFFHFLPEEMEEIGRNTENTKKKLDVQLSWPIGCLHFWSWAICMKWGQCLMKESTWLFQWFSPGGFGLTDLRRLVSQEQKYFADCHALCQASRAVLIKYSSFNNRGSLLFLTPLPWPYLLKKSRSLFCPVFSRWVKICLPPPLNHPVVK